MKPIQLLPHPGLYCGMFTHISFHILLPIGVITNVNYPASDPVEQHLQAQEPRWQERRCSQTQGGD